jgi:hypothetical protein
MTGEAALYEADTCRIHVGPGTRYGDNICRLVRSEHSMIQQKQARASSRLHAA